MTELQGWLIVVAVWVSAGATCWRAYTAWRAAHVEYARAALEILGKSGMTIGRLDPDPPRVGVRES